MSMLHVHVDVHIDDGSDYSWDADRHVEVPPDYTDADLDPFVLHEMERGLQNLQRQKLGRARGGDIIHDLDLRLEVIRGLALRAPRSQSRQQFAERVLEIIEMPSDELNTKFAAIHLEE